MKVPDYWRIMASSLILLFQSPGAFPESAEPDPQPLLVIEGIGNGYSTPAVTSGRIFVTGEHEGTGYLYAYDLRGQLQWKADYGREWIANFRGSRASPVIAGSLVYTNSGMGDIACFDTGTGVKRWSLNMIRELHGANATFGYSMPVVIDNDRLYCQPGGADTNIACLDRFTGKILWTAKGTGDTPGYASPVVVRHNGRSILVAFSEMSMMGMDAGTGEDIWTTDLNIAGLALCNTPVYSDGYLYVVQGRGNGAARYEIAANGSGISKTWDNPGFTPYFGGFAKIDGYLYASSDDHHAYWSVNTETGRQEDTLSFGAGATVSDGRDLVLYSQSGKVGLVRADRGKMTLLKTLGITKGTGEHFSHPVVSENLLFIRHGNALLIYDYRHLVS